MTHERYFVYITDTKVSLHIRNNNFFSRSVIMKFIGLIIFITFVLCCNGTIENRIVKARIESCPGCSLNRLHDVKKFVYEDIGKYDNVEWKKISGAPPELIFYNSVDEEVERHQLSKLSRKECNELLSSKGFSMRTSDKEL